MDDLYGSIGEIMGNLEADDAIIECMILSGSNERVNRKLRDAREEIKHALSDLPDALFDATVL